MKTKKSKSSKSATLHKFQELVDKFEWTIRSEQPTTSGSIYAAQKQRYIKVRLALVDFVVKLIEDRE